MKLCTHEGCSKPYRAKGYCSTHYNHIVKYGEIRERQKNTKLRRVSIKKQKEPCSVLTCEDMARSKGYCNKHYQRLKRHGDPLVNYTRKYRTTPRLVIDNIFKPETGRFNRLEETLILKEIFQDTMCEHELEACF